MVFKPRIFQRGGGQETVDRLNATTTPSTTSDRQAAGKQNMVLLSTCSHMDEYYDDKTALSTSDDDNTTFATSYGGESTVADSILDFRSQSMMKHHHYRNTREDQTSLCMTNWEIVYWVEEFFAHYGLFAKQDHSRTIRRKFRHVQRLLAEAEKERMQVQDRLNRVEEERLRELDAVKAQIEHTMTQQIKSLEDKLVATAMGLKINAATKQNGGKQKQQQAARPMWRRQQQQQQESRNDDDAEDDSHYVRDLQAAKKESKGNPAMQKIKELKQKLMKASRLPPLKEVRVGDDHIEQRQEHGDQNQAKDDHASAQLLLFENSKEEDEHVVPAITTVDSCGALTTLGVEETQSGLIGHVNKSSGAKMENKEAAERHVEDAEEKREGSETAIAEDKTMKKDEHGKDEQTPLQSSTECSHSFDILGSMMYDLAMFCTGGSFLKKVQLFGTTSNSSANPLTTTSSEAQKDEEQQQKADEQQQDLTATEAEEQQRQQEVEEQQDLTAKEADEPQQQQVEEQQDLTEKEDQVGAVVVEEEHSTTSTPSCLGEKKKRRRPLLLPARFRRAEF